MGQFEFLSVYGLRWVENGFIHLGFLCVYVCESSVAWLQNTKSAFPQGPCNSMVFRGLLCFGGHVRR